MIDLAHRLPGAEASLPALRRQVLTLDDRQGANWLLKGDARVVVLPLQRCLPLLRRDPRLMAVLPAQGAPLHWTLLARPEATREPFRKLGAKSWTLFTRAPVGTGVESTMSEQSWPGQGCASGTMALLVLHLNAFGRVAGRSLPCRLSSAMICCNAGRLQPHSRRLGAAARRWCVSLKRSGMGRSWGQRGRHSPQPRHASAFTDSHQCPARPIRLYRS